VHLSSLSSLESFVCHLLPSDIIHNLTVQRSAGLFIMTDISIFISTGIGF